VSVSPDGRWLAAGGQDSAGMNSRNLHLWDLETGELVRSWPAHRSVTMQVAFSPDSKQLVSYGGDRYVAVWDLSSGDRVARLEGNSQMFRTVAISSDGSAIAACAADEQALLWESRSGTLLGEFKARVCDSLASVRFSRDDAWLIAGGGPFRWTQQGPGAVEAWDLSELKRELAQLGLGGSRANAKETVSADRVKD
jgi:WD40 repeat protein